MHKLAVFAALTFSVASLAAPPAAPAPAPAAAAPAAPAAPAAAPAAPAAPAAAPDPAAERKAKREALKRFDKSWRCEGKMMKPDGTEVAHKFAMKGKAVADGAWISTSKTWTVPSARKQEALVGWDAATNSYRLTEVTSEGTMVNCTSPGLVGDVWEWSCDGSSEGKPAKRKMTTTYTGDKQSITVGEVQLPDGTWKKIVEGTCKR